MPSDNSPTSSELRDLYFKKEKTKYQPHEIVKPTPTNSLTTGARYISTEIRKVVSEIKLSEVNGITYEEKLFDILEEVCESKGEYLTETEKTAIVAHIASTSDAFDILTPLIEDPTVNDIIVRYHNDISVQCNGRNYQTDVNFPDPTSYRSFIERLLKSVGKDCTTANPVVDAAITENVRACITHESFSPPGSGPMLTLRISRHKNMTIKDIINSGVAPKEIIQYLSGITKSGDATILIAGEVSTGKTTLVKALANEIDHEEAILIIEDTNELVLNRPFARTLITREPNSEGYGRIEPHVAIRTGMRMAMNRVILGEMRDAQAAEAFIDVSMSGHPGMSTIHAKSAKDAISRLEIFLSRAQSNNNYETIRRQIANSISLVVYLCLDRKTNTRYIKEISEVRPGESGRIQLATIYKFESFHSNSYLGPRQ